MEFEVWLWFFSVIERELGEARFKHFLSKYRAYPYGGGKQ